MWNTLDVSSLFRSSVGGEINRAAFNDSINVSELELVTICAVNHRWTTQIALIVIPFFFLSTAKILQNEKNSVNSLFGFVTFYQVSKFHEKNFWSITSIEFSIIFASQFCFDF